MVNEPRTHTPSPHVPIHVDAARALSADSADASAKPASPASHSGAASSAAPAGAQPYAFAGLTIAQVERMHIAEALRRHKGCRTDAARELGISRRTLHYRIAAYKSMGEPIE